MISRLECPHCGKPGITTMRKIFLGPAVPATCKACGRKIGVPYTAMLPFILFIGAILLLSPLLEPFWLKVALWAGGFIAVSVAQVRWVPLQKR